MKKLLKLFVVFILLTNAGDVWTQQNTSILHPKPIDFPQFYPTKNAKPQVRNYKSFGDTLYYEDFDSSGTGGLPLGWTTVSNNGHGNHVWIWSDTAPGGQFSTGIGPLQSVTSSNGYLLLPSDLYNTHTSSGSVAMDAIVTSPVIPIQSNPSVFMEFDYYYRYCCGMSVSLLVVEVSSDSVNWLTFDITQGRPQSAVTPNPEHFRVDVSSALANQDTAYIRFKQRGATHYFYMVDDLMLVDGHEDDLLLNYSEMTFPTGNIFEPKYTIVPCFTHFDINVKFSGKNLSPNQRTGVMGEIQVEHDSLLTGGMGRGLTFQNQQLNSRPLLFNDQSDTFSFNLNQLSLNYYGYFKFGLSISSDSIHADPRQAQEELFLTYSDSLFAKDNNQFDDKISTADFGTGGINGDCFASLYNVKTFSFTGSATGISIFIANDTNNIGLSLVPKIWRFDESQPSLNASVLNLVASSPFVTTLSASDLGQWKTLPLFPLVLLMDTTQYLVGVEQISTVNSNHSLTLGVDLTAKQNVTPVSNLVYLSAVSNWGWFNEMLGIRLVDKWACHVGVSEEDNKYNQMSISPNPSRGQFAIKKNSSISEGSLLQIRNSLGQVVFQKQMLKDQVKVDLSDQQAGLYFVSIGEGKNRKVKKLVIQ